MEKEELLEIKAKYKRLYDVLNILNYLFGKNNDMDLYEMNSWLAKIIEFYRSYGIELSINDFSVDDSKYNNIVKRYMNVFFNNINDLDSDKFTEVLFGINELEFSIDVNNPIMKMIYMAVKGIHVRNIRILDKLFNSVNKELIELGINKVNFDNIDIIMEEIENKIIDCDISIKQIDMINDNAKSMETLERHILMILTNGSYEQMSNYKKEKIYDKLFDICLLVVKLKIFNSYSKVYEEYSRDKNYKQLLDIVKGKMINYNQYCQKRDIVSKISSDMIKVFLLPRLDNKINKLESECEEIVANYLNGFYMICGISSLDSEYGEIELCDDTKLFGEFEFETLPPSVGKVNSLSFYANMGIIIPDENSSSFNELSELALKYIENNSCLFDDKKDQICKTRNRE